MKLNPIANQDDDDAYGALFCLFFLFARLARFADVDAFIMNPSFKLEWLLEVANKQRETDGPDGGWGEKKKRVVDNCKNK